jgi:Flp pilus assembly pilin Flp
MLQKVLRNQGGAILAEYALLGTLIAVACVAAVAAFGEQIPVLFSGILGAF